LGNNIDMQMDKVQIYFFLRLRMSEGDKDYKVKSHSTLNLGDARLVVSAEKDGPGPSRKLQ